MPTMVSNGEDQDLGRRFHDPAPFGIDPRRASHPISTGVSETTGQTCRTSGDHAYGAGEVVEEPRLVADTITDRNGHILPFVRFEGGRLDLDPGVERTPGTAGRMNAPAPPQRVPAAGPAREALRQKGQFWTPDAMVAYQAVAKVPRVQTRRAAPPGRGAGRVLPPRERRWGESRKRFDPPARGKSAPHPRIGADSGSLPGAVRMRGTFSTGC